jgi:hydroxyethylthiazole kinase-like sugar kinase family protein
LLIKIKSGVAAVAGKEDICAIEKDYLFATIAGLIYFKIAEESIDKTSEVLGTFKTKLFDKIITLDVLINKMKKFEEVK